MEKIEIYKETELWVIRDHDGLYLCTKKPFKNYYGEHEDDFKWYCDGGDFMKINVSPDNQFSDIEYSDEPHCAEIVPLLKKGE